MSEDTGRQLYLVAEFDDSPLNHGKLITDAHMARQITSKEAYARYDQERKRCIEIVAEAYANGIVFDFDAAAKYGMSRALDLTVLYGTGKEEPKGILHDLEDAKRGR